MDPIARLRDILAQITYKPGWVIKLEANNEFFPKGKIEYGIRVIAKSPNADDPTQVAYINTGSTLPDWMLDAPETDVVEWVYKTVATLEAHEQAEFFRYRGKHHVDPHPDR